MTDIQSIALSGLNKAAGKVAAATATIARAGTRLAAVNDGKAATPAAAGAIFSQSTGFDASQLQGIDDGDLVSAIIDVKVGQAAYEANAAVIRSQNDLEREFIRDIKI